MLGLPYPDKGKNMMFRTILVGKNPANMILHPFFPSLSPFLKGKNCLFSEKSEKQAI